MKIATQEIEIEHLTPDDLTQFRDLIKLFQEVFEMKDAGMISNDELIRLLSNTDFVAFTMLYNGIVAGGATAYILRPYHAQKPELFIYDVAIHPTYQRKGLGARLIAALQDYCRQNNIGEMFVPANEEDIHALQFYGNTGGKPEKVVHFNYDV